MLGEIARARHGAGAAADIHPRDLAGRAVTMIRNLPKVDG